MVQHDFRYTLLNPAHTLNECRALSPGRYQVTGTGGSIQAGDELLVIASLSNSAFTDGYRIQSSRIADGRWREIFNSDTTGYGGSGLVDADPIPSAGGVFSARLPANSVLVFQRQ